ncbi:hypothetical protein DMA11_22315 [Marinilabiliaceae bacterium JC017]|nr:hypothetical protein DMA11_22315 [Marinilabiliaceae bacterium JC017]
MKIEKINHWFENLGHAIIRWRWLIIFAFIAVVGISFMGLKQLVVKSTWDDYFLEGDPMLVKTDEFKEIFGNDYFIAVLTQSENVFSQESLALIRELSNELRDSISYSEKITSLTDIEFLTGTEYGMQIEQIVPDVIPSDAKGLKAISDKVFSKPKVASRLVSRDGTLSWILVKLRTFPEDSVWQKESDVAPDFLTGLETDRIINKEKYKALSPKATGMPYIAFKKQEFFKSETGRVVGLALIFAVLVLIFATRSFRGVVIPIVTSFSSIIVVYGLLGYVGYSIDSGVISVPILLAFAIAVAYNIHVFSYFKKQLLARGLRKKAVVAAIKEMGWPVLFSALTTMAALLSFLTISVKPIRFVGIASSLCVLFTLLTVLLLLPALLSFGKDYKSKSPVRQEKRRWIDGVMEKLSERVMNHSKTIGIVSGVLTVILIYGATKVEPAFDIERTMGRKISYIKNLLDISESELGSLYSYDLLVEFPENGQAKLPVNLRKLDEVSTYVDSFQLTKRTTSILDIVKDLNQTLNENQEAYYDIPGNENQVAQMLLLYENAGGTESEYWMDYDYKRLRLMVELATYNSAEAERELAAIEVKARELFPEANVTTVGNLPQFTTMMQYVVRGQVLSFFIALGVIGILLMVVFGSIRTGLIGLIPNVAPAIAVGGVMGWLDIPLDQMTATVIPMILGLAVDDTIHFINHGNLEFKRTRNYNAAIKRTFGVVGVALLFSTLVISVNFMVYTTSLAKAFFNLGLLAVVGLVSALLADLCLTPLLFKKFKIFGSEEVKAVSESPKTKLEKQRVEMEMVD